MYLIKLIKQKLLRTSCNKKEKNKEELSQKDLMHDFNIREQIEQCNQNQKLKLKEK
jgi:hypothetical protein